MATTVRVRGLRADDFNQPQGVRRGLTMRTTGANARWLIEIGHAPIKSTQPACSVSTVCSVSRR